MTEPVPAAAPARPVLPLSAARPDEVYAVYEGLPEGWLPDWQGPDVLADVARERVRQMVEKGWTLEHDDGHDAEAFFDFIIIRLDLAEDAVTRGNGALYRHRMVQVAALAIAAIERLDRALPCSAAEGATVAGDAAVAPPAEGSTGP